jgi:uncharacterized membrane protein
MKTPTSIMVISILRIIYGGLGILFTPCSAFLTFHPLMPSPMLDALHRDSAYMTIYFITLFVHFSLAVVLTASSIASLKLKPWGRAGMIVYAWSLVVMTAFNTVLTVAWVLPRMEAAAAGTPAAPLMKMSGMIGAAFGIVLGVGLAAVILYFFNRRIAIDAFNGIFPVPPSDFPVEHPGFGPPADVPPPG